jgi:hypothetical protein
MMKKIFTKTFYDLPAAEQAGIVAVAINDLQTAFWIDKEGERKAKRRIRYLERKMEEVASMQAQGGKGNEGMQP